MCVIYHLLQSGSTSRRSSGAGARGGHGFAKEFVLDHSYWSVCENDEHFVDQEKVKCVIYMYGR